MESSKIEGEKTKKKDCVPFHRLYAFADSYDVVLIILGTLGALLAGASLPFAAYAFGNVLDSMAMPWSDAHTQLQKMSEAALHSLFVGLLSAGGYFFQVTCWMTTGERQAGRIRYLHLQALLRQDLSFFDQEISTGVVLEGMSADTFYIKQATGEKVGKLVQILGTLLSGYGIAFSQGWKLTLFISAFIPLLMASGYAMDLTISKTSRKVLAANRNAGKIVEQVISAIRTVVPFNGEKRAVQAYDKALQKADRASFYESLAAGLGMGGIMFFTFSVYALMLWFGAQLIVHGGYTGGKVLTVLFSIIIGTGALGQSTPSLAAIAAGSAAAHKTFKVIYRVPDVDISDESGQVLDALEGHIEFKNVRFAYPSRPDHEIFADFTLDVVAGTTVALVGESGSGKSTVVSLIERFYDPLAGEVLIDGINLKKLRLSWFRRQVGLVSQEPVLLGASIRDNIAYGRDGATEEEIHMAAQLANAWKFISRLPEGWNTMVGQGGLPLSGGQKQRIAIARAVLKDPRILLLDEATSSLDAESESLVHEALQKILVNRTTLIIAHRLTTVKNAHIITVLRRGNIVEQGSHLDLLNKPNGVFTQLVSMEERLRSVREQQQLQLAKIEMEPCQQSKAMSNMSAATHQRLISKASSRSMSFGSIASFGSITIDNEMEHWWLQNGQIDNKNPTTWCSHFLHLAGFNKPELPVLLLGSVAAGANGAIMPIVGLLFANIIRAFYEPLDEIRSGCLVWIHLFVVVACVSLVVVPLQNVCFSIAGEKLVHRIRLLTFDKILHQEMEWFDESENNIGIISSRLLRDALHMRTMVGDVVALIVQNLSTIVVGLFIAISTCWPLALLFVGLLPFYGLDGFMQIKLGENFDAKAKIMYEETSQVAHEALSSIRMVASFCAEQKVLGFYQAKSMDCVKVGIRRALINGFGLAVSYVVMYGSLGLSFWVGGQLVYSSKITFDGFVKTFLAIELSAFAVSLSVAVAPDISSVKPAVASIFTMLDLKSKDLTSGTKLKRLKGEVEFRHVYFTYPSRPDTQVFYDLSFILGAGKTLAIVGESGGGKSTVLALMQRFYDPDEGHIFLDKVDIKQLQTKWLRRQMGLVSQEPFLFNDTIRANIKYGIGGEVSEEEMQKAAEIANAHNFISGLPSGYESMVGERGVQLSGGQRQRIAIARAMVRDPRIVLLDEATSALDAEAELLVQGALEKAAVGRSTMVVAHRLSTVRNADKIIVLKDGCVAEQGTHDELVTCEHGLYAALVRISIYPRGSIEVRSNE